MNFIPEYGVMRDPDGSISLVPEIIKLCSRKSCTDASGDTQVLNSELVFKMYFVQKILN